MGVIAWSAEDKEYKGVLIDQKCGAKQMSKDDPEKSAATFDVAYTDLGLIGERSCRISPPASSNEW